MAARRRHTKHIVLHCSATRPNQDVGAREIRTWHIARGWADIGYHYVIRRDGRLETGRPADQIGAHVAGHNADTLGVCLVGGLNTRTAQPEDNFTPEQWQTLRALLRDLTGKYPGVTILGHRDLSPDRNGDGVIAPNEWLKACPCFDARTWATENGFAPAPGGSAKPKTMTRSKVGLGQVAVATTGIVTAGAQIASEVTPTAPETITVIRESVDSVGAIVATTKTVVQSAPDGFWAGLVGALSSPLAVVAMASIAVAVALATWAWRRKRLLADGEW